MKLEPVVPILVAILTAFVSFVIWVVQRTIERRHAERHRKEQLYEGLLEAIVQLSSFGDGAPIIVESQKAWLYATDDVLEAITEYQGIWRGDPNRQPGTPPTPDERNKRNAAEAKIRLQIRRDLFPRTRLTPHWMKTSGCHQSQRREKLFATTLIERLARNVNPSPNSWPRSGRSGLVGFSNGSDKAYCMSCGIK